jgi:hypothetical protein|tara:strand:- start:689 stop:1912 length:1224 start_codon:yes stop_codon:yes gene_type:complete
MTEENKEVIEEITEQPTEEKVENKMEQPRDEKGQFKSKFESAGDDSVVKVDLSKPPPIQSEEIKEEPVVDEKTNVVEDTKSETPVETVTEEETSVLEEITVEDLKETETETVEDQIEEAITEAEVTGKPLPENIQKLVDFMDDTGGDIQDYVNLNRDISKMDDSEVLDEYYRATKPHLSPEERNFLLEEKYGVDEDIDDERSSRLKKIALKEQVAEARAHLDGQKSKYYEEIKAGSKLTQEQQEAIDFFNRYNKESESQKKLSEESKLKFKQKTDSVFNKEFKGFEYNVGDKKYRFNVKDADKVKANQSDINNFINKFVGKDNSTIEDAKGYHKSLFTAMNADAIANHFYEQGKADAIKARVAKDKNINTEPRKSHGEVNVGGVRYRVLGDSTSDIKNRSFKIRKKN